MLVGIDTGHEGKFDFPRRMTAPERTYMIATVPRTGSSWFGHLLWQTGCLGAPLEYLNFDPAGPYSFAKSASLQSQLWHSVLARRTSPNGVFGVKCFPGQLEALEQSNPGLLAAVMSSIVPKRSARIVHLRRRDRTAHAISFARATISGVWRKEQEGDVTEVGFSEAAVDRARELLVSQDAAWGKMFDELRIEPLGLWYEDVLADPGAAVTQVADYLGVTLDPAATVDVPVIEKQSAADSAAWAERYAARRANT